MGRPSTWNEAELLTEVRRTFRRRGFSATSLRDLEAATGVHPGSLYRTYGDKRGLFVAALSSYNDCVVTRRVNEHLRANHDPLAGIYAFFRTAFTEMVDDVPGCLITNSAVESLEVDDAARREVERGLRIIEEGFAAALERLHVDGPAALAGQLLALYQGLLVLVRFGTGAEQLEVIVVGAVGALVGNQSEGNVP